MVSFRTLLPTFVLLAFAECKINWGGCNQLQALQFNSSTIPVPFQCGTLDVPLDYSSQNSSEKLTLELLKAPAPLESKGSILVNTGGPGLPNRQDFSTLARNLIPLTGGQYDLIAFDSRGTVNTAPLTCYEDPIQEIKSFLGQKPSNKSDVAVGELWTRGTVDAEACFEAGSKNGSVMTTAFVARDLVSVVDALEEDGLLRYWGFSYGTILGATVAAMFPERIDKIIFDAVQNVHEYYHAQANFEEWELSDTLFSAIFSECVKAGPELCALAAHNETAEELEAAAYELLEISKYQPFPVGQLVVDYAAVKSTYAQSLYTQRAWPLTTALVDVLFYGTESSIEEVLSGLPHINITGLTLPGLAATDIALAGIYCSDNQVRTESFDEFVPAIDKLYSLSQIMGDLGVSSYMRCQQWKIKPKETYRGSLEHVQIKNPPLFIGNTLDGHTPLKSAYNVSASFEGSVVLEIDGYGHGSTAVPSECSLKAISAYWVNGTLPEPGTRCARDVEPYTNDWWPEVFKAAGVNETWIHKG
ncbi:uncharacterized protein DSM5745_02001 [Aspergillus mulundensis]|uniref:Peptidase S33 tripeptidyl aminopeptidase-like C-terminal domain-containing protein n=1 Tax=Aspergillus mulundensis TaxID=1810919 RepID=A0A3D8SVA6_9EURO|nr:Uncharacterized protein DSM5745_02001 [Aspergillus mulundensis]RDW90226.1 Uncharacterized protein DSM5745_02001 [Aspergillus mulundensis]